jgi:hypothetical protein
MNVIVDISVSQDLLVCITFAVVLSIVAWVARSGFVHLPILINITGWQLISVSILISLDIKSQVLIKLFRILVVKAISSSNFLIVASVIEISSSMIIQGILPLTVIKLLELLEFTVSLVVH